jgi:hypothetical protein
MGRDVAILVWYRNVGIGGIGIREKLKYKISENCSAIRIPRPRKTSIKL